MISEYIASWLQKADRDLAIVEHEMRLADEERINDMMCFHCQQAAEKCFKALLIYVEQDVPKTHNIEMLIRLLSGKFPDISEFDVRDLSLFGVDIRYPDDLYIPDASEVIFYYNLAVLIRKYVHSKMI